MKALLQLFYVTEPVKVCFFKILFIKLLRGMGWDNSSWNKCWFSLILAQNLLNIENDIGSAPVF